MQYTYRIEHLAVTATHILLDGSCCLHMYMCVNPQICKMCLWNQVQPFHNFLKVAFLLLCLHHGISVQGMNTCTAEPSTVTVGEGGKIICVFSSSPSNGFSIKKNGTSVVDCPKLATIACSMEQKGYNFTYAEGQNIQTLIIKQATMEQAGDYICEIAGVNSEACTLKVTEMATTTVMDDSTKGSDVTGNSDRNGGPNVIAIVVPIVVGLVLIVVAVVGISHILHKKKLSVAAKSKYTPIPEKEAMENTRLCSPAAKTDTGGGGNQQAAKPPALNASTLSPAVDKDTEAGNQQAAKPPALNASTPSPAAEKDAEAGNQQAAKPPVLNASTPSHAAEKDAEAGNQQAAKPPALNASTPSPAVDKDTEAGNQQAAKQTAESAQTSSHAAETDLVTGAQPPAQQAMEKD